MERDPERETTGPDLDPDVHEGAEDAEHRADEDLTTEELGEGGPAGA